MLYLQRILRVAATCAVCLQTASSAPSQTPSGSPVPSAISPKQWAADAAENEIEMLTHERSYLRYRIHEVNAKGDQLRDIVESKDGTVARLIAKDNRPLTPQEDSAERQRLQSMLASPAAFTKHVKNDQASKRLAADLLRQMPAAMIFTFAPGQPRRTHGESLAGEPSEMVLDFHPDPAWVPPSLAAEALSGFEGRLWIDASTHHVTRLEGHVFRGVNFGLGIFGHIYPGGNVILEQAQVGDDRWIFTHFTDHLTLRVVVRTINQNSELQGSDFTPIPKMSYLEAIHLLLAPPPPSR